MDKYLIITKHSSERFCQRTKNEVALKKFLRLINDRFCEIVFELVKDGCVNGPAKRYHILDRKFVITYDELKMKIVLKTII